MVDTVKILGALLGGGNMSSGSGANILKSVLGAATQGGQQGGGGLGDLLGSVLKGAQGGNQSGGGGLGDVLGSVLGGGKSGGGGLGDVLGSVLGGGSQGGQQGAQQGGGLGDILGGVLGGKPQGPSGNAGADLSDLIGAALNQFGHAEQAAQRGEPEPSFEQFNQGMVHSEACDQATVMVRAMINAAKADGRVDKEEQQKILGKLGSVTQDEIDFVNNELAESLDVQGFARSVPNGLENQVYAMSLMAIDLDSQGEAKYLHQLGQAMGIEPQVSNKIHQQLGAPVLYS
ncbi:MAG: DUF533 domain-containing protein [bacterium]